MILVARAVGSRRVTPVASATLLLVALLVAACGSTTVSATPPASGTTPSTVPGSGDVAGPSPSSWPGTVVEAVMNLAKADAQIQAAGTDLANAAAYEDLKAMWGAADGLATLLDKLTFEVSRIKDYPATAAAYNAYQVAFPEMLTGAKELRDAISANDAAGVTAGSQRLAEGLQAYADARREIGPLADQALLMQKLLSK